METQIKATPKTLSELAQASSEVAEAIDALTNGTDDLLFKDQVTEVVDRIEQFNEIDGPAAAFHGITYAWLLAKFPHLYQLLAIEVERYRPHVVLRARPHQITLLLPRVFSYVDDEFAERSPEVGE